MPNWIPKTWEEVCRRAAGRAKHNAARHREQQHRRKELARLVGGMEWYGCQRELAEYFGVNKSTISRDMKALNLACCPHCGRPVSQEGHAS